MPNKMTGEELVKFCRSKLGTAYIYGAKGEVMTKDRFELLRKLYSRYVPYSDSKKIGEVCVDCSGLISWACIFGRVSRYGSRKERSAFKFFQ